MQAASSSEISLSIGASCAKNYKQTAADVLRLVGGEKNVSQLEHCSTRLRFSLTDSGKADVDALKKAPGVMGVITGGPQCQVVIGNDVIEVYNELVKMGHFSAAAGGQKPAASGKKNWGGIILDYIVGIFQPLVPTIAGAGILKALLTLCTTFGLLASSDVIYKVFYAVADAALYFLPVMVAYTAATKLNCNKLVAVATVGTMIMPGTSALLATEGGARLFGIPLQNVAYTYQVFPAILTVIFLALVEHLVTKWCPKPIRVFFVPMVCFMVTFPVALLFLGPLGYNIGTLLTAVILALYNTLGWLAVALLAAALPFMIATGMHKALVPYAVASISDPGFEMLYMPASLAHNIAEGGACFAVALRTKDENLRSTAISAGISAVFGITEPALYGVNLQHKRALAGVCAGSFIAGLFVGIMKVKAFVAMGPGIAGMAMFLDPDNSMNLVWASVGLVVALAAAFLITLVTYKDESTDAASVGQGQSSVPADGVLVSPLQGKILPLSQVKDEVFATGVLGQGLAMVPEKGELYAPADATVEMIPESKHAISLTTADGAELLIHIGMDTVRLEGKGFEPQVKQGDKVQKGQLLMKFDLGTIQKAGFDATTPMVVTNADEFELFQMTEGTTSVGAPLMKLSKK